MKGIIVGAGIGGLSTAIALIEHNINVKIYEAASTLSPIGAGILVPPNALIVLDRYGLLHKVKDVGVSIESLVVFDNKGKEISKTPAMFSKNGNHYQTVAIHRGELQKVLLSSLPSDVIITGKRCSQVIANQRYAEITFDDNTSLKPEFVIGADGLNSRVRESIFPGQKLRYSGQVCWRGISNLQLSSNWSVQLSEFWGAGVRFGFVPIDSNRVYWYATRVCEADTLNQNASTNEMLASIYKDFPDVVLEIIKQTDNSGIFQDAINNLSPMESWFKKSVVLIGDAAHASTPNLGQGGAQAIEDSWVLSEKVANCGSLEEAFAQYQKLRITKAKKIVNISRQIGQVTNYTNSMACMVRNSIFRCVPGFVTKQQARFLYNVIH
ncbi:FAD-dependent monooxygenase [Pseudoalteromonas xiamenensis]